MIDAKQQEASIGMEELFRQDSYLRSCEAIVTASGPEGISLDRTVFYPTGGGTGLIGMWKAFAELEALGWIGSERPRMYAVQAAGCAPIVRAFDAGERHHQREQRRSRQVEVREEPVDHPDRKSVV